MILVCDDGDWTEYVGWSSSSYRSSSSSARDYRKGNVLRDSVLGVCNASKEGQYAIDADDEINESSTDTYVCRSGLWLSTTEFELDTKGFPTDTVVGAWLSAQGLSRVVPEYRYGASRIDFYLEREAAGAVERMLMEVKGCTLVKDGVGLFPDAPTARGARHLRELMHAVGEGYRPLIAFVAQTDGVSEVRAHEEMDPAFAATLDEARHLGVTVITLPCHVEPDSLEVLPEVTLPF
jgi:hypothetical protein